MFKSILPRLNKLTLFERFLLLFKKEHMSIDYGYKGERGCMVLYKILNDKTVITKVEYI